MNPTQSAADAGGLVRWAIGSIGEADSPKTVIRTAAGLHVLDALLESEQREEDTRVTSILDQWELWRPRLAMLAAGATPATALDESSVTWLPPVCFPRKLIVCGSNYRDHVTEMGVDPDSIEYPLTVMKPPSTSLIGTGSPIEAPAQVKWLDWEGEFAVVIGKRVRNVRVEDALDAVAGYCPVNDVSARDRIGTPIPGIGMDWTFHKGFDKFTPAGPLMTPAEFVKDPQALDIELTVNGVVKQQASSSLMIFSVAELIAHVTTIITLEPGDMLLTGTPSGSGFARTPKERLVAGDEVRVSVSGLGELVNPVIAAETDDDRSR